MNVLLIAIDTLRADHLGCYGWHRPTSPHIDRLAAKGVVFEDFIAPHIPTHPGYTTLFTGKDVFTHQIVTQGGLQGLDSSILTLPQLMEEHGYYTAAADNLGRWFRNGYEVYETYAWGNDPRGAWLKAEAVSAAAFTALDACEGQERPWFCFLHYWEPHTPYLPPRPFDRMFYHGDETDACHTSALEMMTDYPAFQYYFQEWMPGLRDVEFPKAQYDAEIAYCDAWLGALFDRVEHMKGGEDTLIILTSDHGEELDEHKMWFDHHGLYDTNICPPLIMVHPQRIPAGLRLKGLARHLDVSPTVLDMVGKPDVARENKMEGASLAPLIDQRSDAGTCDRVYITENAWMKKRGFRTMQHKFIKSLYDELHHRPPYELYDLTTDPGEQVNLADTQPQLRGQFDRELEEHIARRMAETGKPDPQSYQDITLRQVGSNVEVAIPADQVLEE